jgi:hypothetical protein
MPHKAGKKCALDAQQREWNRLVGSLRVVVEHAIGGMKRFNAASAVYRNRLPKTDDRFNVLAADLWNFLIS